MTNIESVLSKGNVENNRKNIRTKQQENTFTVRPLLPKHENPQQ